MNMECPANDGMQAESDPLELEKRTNAPDIEVNLMFDASCRDTCSALLHSAQGMVTNGFIGEHGIQPRIVASISLREYGTFDAYVAHVRKSEGGNSVREALKAQKAGLFVEKFPWYLYIPDIHAINVSAQQRGGQPMSANYRRSIEEMGGAPTRPVPLPKHVCPFHHKTCFGVFRRIPDYKQGDVVTDQQLLAYLSLNRYGNCAIYTLFLGHHDFLKQHIMNFLHFEVVKAAYDPTDSDFHGLNYLMYHRYYNVNKGLTFWKKKVAFIPVRWINMGSAVTEWPLNGKKEVSSNAIPVEGINIGLDDVRNNPGTTSDQDSSPEQNSKEQASPGPSGKQPMQTKPYNLDPLDSRYGTDTLGDTVTRDELGASSPNLKYANGYQGTASLTLLSDALNALRMTDQEIADCTFVDLGSGKGRMVILAGLRGFKKSIGVEFSPILAEIACDNLSKVGLLNTETILLDAGEFSFPPGNLVVYLYNSFRGQVLRSVLENLRRGLSGTLYLLYRNPRCADLVHTCDWLRYEGEVPGWEGPCGVHIWRADAQGVDKTAHMGMVPLCAICKTPLVADGITENCACCQSRPRIRTLVPALERVRAVSGVTSFTKPGLIFSPSTQEWDIVARYCPERLSVTLYGKYCGNSLEGVDTRDLARFADNSFSLHYSCMLFDYFEEHETALAEAWRVLEPGGVFITHIAPTRLAIPSTLPPQTASYILDRKTSYLAYVPDGADVPSVKVGADWFVGAMKKAGFRAFCYTFQDPLSPDIQTWFVGVKEAPEGSESGFESGQSAAVNVVQGATNNVCAICGQPLVPDGDTENCSYCHSRPRVRSFGSALQVAHKETASNMLELPGLIFSPSRQEYTLAGIYHKELAAVTRYGEFGAQCRKNVDARALDAYGDNSFSAHYSSLLFDFFEEHEAALAEAWRVLEPGGIFLNHITPNRLAPDRQQPPKVMSYLHGRKSAHFACAPEEERIPSVSVGTDWFAAAMKKAGFKTTCLEYCDPLSSDVQTWFMGVKAVPSQRDDKINTSGVPLDSSCESLFKAKFLLGNKEVVINFEHLILPIGNTVKNKNPYMRLLDCRNGILAAEIYPNIYLSKDNGVSWVKFYEGEKEDGYCECVFIMHDGSILLLYQNDKGMIHINTEGKMIHSYDSLKYGWHGSQGIGQSESGVVMFAEYPSRRQVEQATEPTIPLTIWRLQPDEEQWESVFRVDSFVTRAMWEQCPVRHFHVCAPTGRTPHEWIASSGDRPRHSRFWLSEDDGEHWREYPVTHPDFDGAAVAPVHFPTLVRFTSFSIANSGEFIWGTDDVIQELGKSVLVLAKPGENNLHCNVFSELGFNSIRNIVKLDSDTFLAVSQAVEHKPVAEFHLVDILQGCVTSFSLPNTTSAAHPITSSLGSREGKHGMFFLPSFRSLLTNKSGIFRVRYAINPSA